MAGDEQLQGGRPRRGEAVRTFLVADRTPMWFTMAVLLAGAGGTYFLAPAVNAEFEAQKIKTDFVIRNYNDLRLKMEDFQGLYTGTVQRFIAGQDVQADITKLQEIIGRIGAQNMSMMPMFTTSEGPQAAGQLTATMNAMLTVIFAHAGKDFAVPDNHAALVKDVEGALSKLPAPLLELYVSIGEVGNLNPTPTTTDLKPRGQ